VWLIVELDFAKLQNRDNAPHIAVLHILCIAAGVAINSIALHRRSS
jgi:hypothetical protein